MLGALIPMQFWGMNRICCLRGSISETPVSAKHWASCLRPVPTLHAAAAVA